MIVLVGACKPHAISAPPRGLRSVINSQSDHIVIHVEDSILLRCIWIEVIHISVGKVIVLACLLNRTL